VAQGVGPEFKSQYHKQNKTKNYVILATWEADIGRIVAWGQPDHQSSGDPSLNGKLVMGAGAFHFSTFRKYKMRDNLGPAGMGKK
jgi:hypothetical protein